MSMGVSGSSLEVNPSDFSVMLKSMSLVNVEQRLHIKANGQLYNQEKGLFVHANGDNVYADPIGRGADRWDMGKNVLFSSYGMYIAVAVNLLRSIS